MAQEVKKGSNNERDYEGKGTACVYTCEREAQRGDEGKRSELAKAEPL